MKRNSRAALCNLCVRLLHCWVLVCLGICASAQNLVTNGNFEQGNLVGFSTNYTFIPTPTGNTNAGQYGIGTNPQPYNTASFISMGDHTTGTGLMMIVDGTNNSGNPEPFFWRIGASGEICGLTVGQTYTFSYWVKSIYNAGIPGASPANIRIKWNNVQGQGGDGWTAITPVSGNTIAPAPGADWAKVTYTFVPTNACVRIEMFDLNGSLAGNDFAIDDIELIPPPQPLSLSYSISPITCPGANNGAIVVYGIGGQLPYTLFTLSGAVTQSNTTGIFTGLAPGTYNVSVRDNAGATVSANNLVITQPAGITVTPATASVCTGAPVTLTASGALAFNWTASPADPSLTNPTSASVTVSPLVTTTYTVTSNSTSARNLLYNGNFSLGNIGFATDYSFLNPTNPTGSQRAYGIVANSQAWWSTFQSCTGIGGSGNMMVVDGSTFGATDRVWCQTIPVQPGQTYTFSYWVQSLTSTNLANLEVLINGVSVNVTTAPVLTCTWVERTVSWNAGAATTAEICIVNRTVSAAGNDFALDDLSFNTNITCNLSASATVTVNGSAAVTNFSYTSPVCNDAANLTPVTAPGFTTGGVFSAPAGLSLNPSTGIINVAASTAGIYTVTYTVAPSGCNAGGSSTASVTIRTLPVLGSGNIVHPPCAGSSGSFTVTMPVGANFQYNINGSAFQNSPVFSGLAPGNYIVRVRDVSTGCISAATSPILPIVINPPPVLAGPQVVVTAPTCPVPFGTITVTSPLGPNLEYSINNVNYQSSPVFSGLTPFTVYNVTYRNTLNGCVSLTTDPVIPALNPPPAPTASVTVQPTCTVPTGVIVITAPLGANLEYSINGITYQTGTTFSGLAPGTYNLRVRNTSTLCVSNLTAVTVNPLPSGPPPPAASVTVQPTCSIASGTIVVSAPLGAGFEYNINGGAFQTSPSFTGLVPGLYDIRVRNVATGCTSTVTTLAVLPPPAAPVAPAVVATQPVCGATTGTATVTSPLGATLQYSLNGIDFQTSPVFPGVLPGNYTVVVRNTATGCTSTATPFVVAAAPPPPAAPSVTVTQPTCITTTGSIQVTVPTGTGFEYSVNGSTYQTATLFSNLLPGTYAVTVRIAATGCVSQATSVVINPVPPALPAPSITINVFPGCISNLTVLRVTAPLGPELRYSLNGGSFQASPTFATAGGAGVYNVVVRNDVTGCVSSPGFITVPPPVLPATPTLNVTVQPNCITPTGTLEVTAPLGANLQYNINGGAYQASPVFSGLAPGIYTVTVRNTSTSCVSAAAAATVTAPPGGPPPPVTLLVQATCTQSTGTITITAPLGAQFEYSIDGSIYQSGTAFVLAPGTYPVTVRSTTTGCVSAPTVVKLDPVPPVPPLPVVTSPVNYCANAIAAPLNASGTNLRWYSTAAGGTASSTVPVPSTATPGTFTFFVTQTINGCESDRASITVNVRPLPVADAGPDQRIFAGQSVQLSGSSSTPGAIPSWSPTTNMTNASSFTPVVSPRTSTTYALTVRTQEGCISVDVVNVTVLQDIVVPNVFSPNGDGVNERWIIKNIEQYSNNRVEIFNRYGERVFEVRNYSSGNAWDGTNKGQPLPVGAYYYVIQLEAGKSPLKGSISIVR